MAARAARQRTGRAAAARCAIENGAIRVRLEGDLCADDLQPVRAAFRTASRGAGDVILDFAEAGAVDAAFLGQVLMLEKLVLRRGSALKVSGASAPIRRILKAHSMSYPQTASGIAPDRETGDAGIAATR
jgi:anti-anti-sigma regulatory factor